MNQFFNEKYDEIVKMAEKITQHRDHKEIAHYVIQQFMEHPRAEELVERGEAMKFMSGMIWRNFHSSTSPYHKLYRQGGRVWSTDTPPETEVEDYDYERDALIEGVEGILEDMMAENVHLWYITLLFKMWIETPNYSELSRKTLIPRTSISAAVQECREEILKRIDGNLN